MIQSKRTAEWKRELPAFFVAVTLMIGLYGAVWRNVPADLKCEAMIDMSMGSVIATALILWVERRLANRPSAKGGRP